MKCPQCQHGNPPQSNFCMKCGRRLTLTCGSCGVDLPLGSRFCNNCGSPVHTSSDSRTAISVRGETSAIKIIDVENEIKTDLVAMSTHGRRGPSPWDFGSVPDKVLHAGKVPVLVVRAG